MSAVRLFVIGDELLSGKRQDRHFAKVLALCAARGIALEGAEFLPDDEARIADAVRRAHADGLPVLSCGGIGATPDDVTRQAAAAAFDLPVVRHPEGVALIEARFGERAYPNRVLMAEFAQGAALIPNPVNDVAGFSLNDCYFVPGFPEMAWPMLEWVLDGPLRRLHQAQPPVEYRLRVMGARGESDLLELMHEVLSRYDGVKLSSLPSPGRNGLPPHIEFGLRGPQPLAAAAYGWLSDQLARVEPALTLEPLHAP